MRRVESFGQHHFALDKSFALDKNRLALVLIGVGNRSGLTEASQVAR